MKKIITLILALVMVLSMAACGKTSSGLPTPEERIAAIKSGEVTEQEAIEMGWLDDEMEAWLKEHGTPAAGGDETGSAGATVAQVPAKLPVLDEYVYEYMGLSYVLPQELRDMLKSGEAWMHNDVQMNGERDFDYSLMFFLLADKDNPGRDFQSYEEYEAWFNTTQHIGSITVFNSEYLKNNTVESVTGCEENAEIGKSSDGKYVFYFSTNPVGDVTELFKETKVTVSDPAPIPSRELDPYFSILGAARENVSELGDFNAQVVDGDTAGNEIFADYELTMVNLWTTTCNYCIMEMPDLEAIRAELQKKGVKFNIVGMCLDVNQGGSVDEKKLDKVKTIISKTGIQYDTLIPDDVLWNGRLKGVNAFPETFFVDKNGNIVGETYVGSNTKADWQEIINKELSNVSK
ncbi:MAG: TlpA disulfide reductase family protein [Oscillospiraceae bacterium]|nr:TlpA disulfide reductase family protein [Oscillospiraceae bacterium]